MESIYFRLLSLKIALLHALTLQTIPHSFAPGHFEGITIGRNVMSFTTHMNEILESLTQIGSVFFYIFLITFFAIFVLLLLF